MSMTNRKSTRREFLGQASCAAVGSTAIASALMNLFLTSAASAQDAGDDYRAIICFFQPGGNDSYNFLVPCGEAEYQEYAAIRGDLALPRESLLPLNSLNSPSRQLALHPAVPELRDLFESEKLALIANVGSLVRPTTLAEYNSGIGLPYGLFSHSDQQEQWQTSIPDSRASLGWAGRMADLLYPSNADSPISMNISIAGNNIFQVGQNVLPYTMNYWGVDALTGYKDWTPYSDIRSKAVDSLLAAEYGNALERTFNRMKKASADAYTQFVAATSLEMPGGLTWGDDGLAQSLLQVARIINGRHVLGVKRQVFFVTWGGWDFHSDVIPNMNAMLPVMSRALKAFYDATAALGVADKVTLFSASDFGRTLTSNAQGSDHAWGGCHLVMGGAVKGKRIYGDFPDLYLGSPLDTGRGALIPTTSVDEYAAEMALWMGVSKANLPYVLPNISRFYSLNSSGGPLGFLV